jgi:hypothetical protein
MRSRWVQYEARLATFLAIEREHYHILTIKLDDCKFPRDLDVELKRRKYLIVEENLDHTLDEVVEILLNDEGLRPRQGDVFVNRGSEFDRLELALSRDKIIHVVGVQGIGKSSLVKEVARRYQRELLQIDLRVGHDLELLARQIIASGKQPQPANNIDEQKLLQEAVQAITERISHGAMLFLNNAHNVMTDEGSFRPFLRTFLDRCAAARLSQ